MKQSVEAIDSCVVTVIPPVHSGVSLYSVGLLSGLEQVSFKRPLAVIINKSAHFKTGSEKLKFYPVWTRDPKYLLQVFSTILKLKPKTAHFQHEFFLYGGMFSALLFPLLILLTRLAGIKVIVTIHGVVSRSETNNQFAEAFFVTSNRLILKIGLATVTSLICKISNCIIVHNKYLKDILTRDFRVPSIKIKVIRHGIGINPQNNQKHKETLRNVLFFGNITPSKGIEVLVEAFEHVKVPDAELIISGSPHPRGREYFAEIQRLIERSPAASRIRLTGYVEDSEIKQLFENCGLVVFPYTIAVSASGGLAFALSYQKPVIVSNLPTFTEIITDSKNGLVVPSNDVTSLASAMERLLSDKDLRERIVTQIRNDSSELIWPVIARKTVECYQNV